MAYVIPVAALVLDHAAAAAAIGEAPDYFDNHKNDRYDGLKRLQQLTGVPIQSFASEDESVFYVGLHIKDDWCIDIDPQLLREAQALKAKHPHPLVQSAKLAVVSQFC